MTCDRRSLSTLYFCTVVSEAVPVIREACFLGPLLFIQPLAEFVSIVDIQKIFTKISVLPLHATGTIGTSKGGANVQSKDPFDRCSKACAPGMVPDSLDRGQCGTASA